MRGNNGFQFLIGNLGTIPLRDVGNALGLFQFLIGNLGTRTHGTFTIFLYNHNIYISNLKINNISILTNCINLSISYILCNIIGR